MTSTPLSTLRRHSFQRWLKGIWTRPPYRCVYRCLPQILRWQVYAKFIGRDLHRHFSGVWWHENIKPASYISCRHQIHVYPHGQVHNNGNTNRYWPFPLEVSYSLRGTKVKVGINAAYSADTEMEVNFPDRKKDGHVMPARWWEQGKLT